MNLVEVLAVAGNLVAGDRQDNVASNHEIAIAESRAHIAGA